METMLRPRLVPVRQGLAYAGLSRSRFYELAALHPDLLVKVGRSSRIDLLALDRFLATLPRGTGAAPGGRAA